MRKVMFRVRTNTGCCSCGSEFESGKKYLVFADGGKRTLSTNSCTRTKLLKYAQKDLQEIVRGQKAQLVVWSDQLSLEPHTSQCPISFRGSCKIRFVATFASIRRRTTKNTEALQSERVRPRPPRSITNTITKH
jgi:hypothetical protein